MDLGDATVGGTTVGGKARSGGSRKLVSRKGGLPTMHESLRAVVFDLDGLMFNTEALYHDVGAELLRRRGHQLTQELHNQMMGRPSPIALRIMIDWHSLDATPEQLQQETDEIFREILATRLAPMPGLERLLETLERVGRPKAIATSSRRSFVTNVLGRYGWEPRFQFILTAEDVTHGKPHPEIYLTASERLGVTPGETLVLEDSQNGCRAAVAAGAYAVAVPGDHSRHHDFTGARHIADTLADPHIYKALGLG
jgi:HAD superfamily hydrolase (TIGR01509 family)